MNVYMDVSAELAALHELASRTATAVEKAVEDGAEAAKKSAQRTTFFLDRTGKLRRNITISGTGPDKRAVTARMPYASFVNDGTRPHEIRAKGSKPLAFQVNGHWVFARKVNHPGTKPRPFMDHAADDGEVVMETSLERRMEQAISRHNK